MFLSGVRPSVETEPLRLVRADALVPAVSVMRDNRALFLRTEAAERVEVRETLYSVPLHFVSNCNFKIENSIQHHV